MYQSRCFYIILFFILTSCFLDSLDRSRPWDVSERSSGKIAVSITVRARFGILRHLPHKEMIFFTPFIRFVSHVEKRLQPKHESSDCQSFDDNHNRCRNKYQNLDY